MSLQSATRPTEGANPRSTRQLLDELDALMDQMLALPVEDEPTTPTVAATLTMIEPVPLAARPPVREPESPDRGPVKLSASTGGQAARGTVVEPEAMVPIKRNGKRPPRGSKPSNTPRHDPPQAEMPPPNWTVGLFEVTPVSADMLVDPVEEIAPEPAAEVIPNPPEPIGATSPAPNAMPPASAFHRESRPMPKSTASWMFRTLVVWDRGFRRWTRRLGPLGWLMRTGAGRVLLGFVGLALWAVALGWLVRDWMQWPR